MNTDIRLSVGFWSHPKTKKTARRLGLDGVRSLQILWLWAAQNRPDGNLSGMDWEDIELAADWQGEERAFFELCLGMWIDETPDGYALHDWQEHNPWQAEADARSEKARKAAQSRWGNAEAKQTQCSSNAQAMPEHSSSNAPLLSSPNQKNKNINTPPIPPADPGTGGGGGGDLPPEHISGCLAPAYPDTPGLEPEVMPPETSYPDIEFQQVLDAYPARARDHAAAWQAWKALKASREYPGLPRLLDGISTWEASGQWQKEAGRFIPLLSNFIGRRKWRDTPPPDTPPQMSDAERRRQRRNQNAIDVLRARQELARDHPEIYGNAIGIDVRALSQGSA